MLCPNVYSASRSKENWLQMAAVTLKIHPNLWIFNIIIYNKIWYWTYPFEHVTSTGQCQFGKFIPNRAEEWSCKPPTSASAGHSNDLAATSYTKPDRTYGTSPSRLEIQSSYIALSWRPTFGQLRLLTFSETQKNRESNNAVWYCMTWHDMTWHDMTWHDMTWHDNSSSCSNMIHFCSQAGHPANTDPLQGSQNGFPADTVGNGQE